MRDIASARSLSSSPPERPPDSIPPNGGIDLTPHNASIQLDRGERVEGYQVPAPNHQRH